MQSLQKLNELSTAMEAARKAAMEHGAAVLKEAMTEFFTTHPKVLGIRWRQYTPYFNDGDECVFGYYDLAYKLGEDGGDYGDGYTDLPWDAKELPEGLTKAALKDLRALNKALSNMEDTLKTTFGDHVEVTVTKAGVTVDEYEHD